MTHRTSSISRSVFRASLFGLPLLASIACGTAPGDASDTSSEALSTSAVGAAGGERNSTLPEGVTTPVRDGTVPGTYANSAPPAYQGGKMLSGTVKVNPIFYGDQWQTGYQAKMTAFLQQLSGTSYWEVVNGYSYTSLYINTPTYVSSTVHGTFLSQAAVQGLVNDAITPSNQPDAQTIYVIYTGDEVYVGNGASSQLCTTYAGYHTAASFTWLNGNASTTTLEIPYAFIGSPQFCNTHSYLNPPPVDAGAGALEWEHSVNGSVIDEAISTEEHQLAETVTDPFPLVGQRAWYPEIGEPCLWNPGPSTLSGGLYSDLGNGEPYKSTQVGFGANSTSPWLVQTIWDKNQNACAFGPVYDDAITQEAACGNWQCGTASNGVGGTYECGNGCQSHQTCSSEHTCVGAICHGAAQCCVWGGGVWTGTFCM